MENSSVNLIVRPLRCNADTVVFAVKNNYPIRKCLACKVLFVHPLPQNSNDIYSADYFQGASQGFGYTDYDHDKEAMRATFIKYLEYIEKNKNRPGRMLDVGAALLAYLESRPAEVNSYFFVDLPQSLSTKMHPATQESIREIVAAYQEFYKNDFTTELKKYRLDYVVVDTGVEAYIPKEWKEIQEINKLKIYQIN